MTASAQGHDVSAYQAPLTAADLDGLSFCFAKATNGPEGTDPNFAANWAVMKSKGIHRGTYHELEASFIQEQAAHFLATVRLQGLEPGDMLAVVASDYSGVTDADVRAFLDELRAAAPRCPALVYSDLSVAATLISCTGYDLWAAWPSATAPADVSPWKTWRFWQWSETGLDRDAYNGTPAELNAWIDSIANPKPPAPPADWTYGPPRNLRATGGHTSVKLTWEPPADAPEPPAEYVIYVYRGTVCNRTTIVASYPRTVTGLSFEGGSLERGHEYTVHVVASGPHGTRTGSYVFASAPFSTG